MVARVILTEGKSMGPVKGNCFEVKGHQILFGIPYKGSEDFVGNLPIDSGDHCVGNRLEIAWFQVSKQPEKQKLFSSSWERVGKKGVIVYVEVLGLHFGGLPYLLGLDVWPGVEAEEASLFWRSSWLKPSHRHINYAQIWLLRENESLLICDRFGGLRILKYASGKLALNEPTPTEVVSYFRKHVQAQNEKRRAWAVRNLELVLDRFPDAEGKN